MRRADLRKQLDATLAEVEKLRAMLDEASEEKDDFVLFLYRCRKSFRWSERRCHKTRRPMEREIDSSYTAAVEQFGWRLGGKVWIELLSISETVIPPKPYH